MTDSPIAQLPLENLTNDTAFSIDTVRLRRQLDFMIEIDKLKGIVRRSPLFGAKRLENDAEHSWHLAMMALLLSEHANVPVDQARVVKMVLIHDIVEIDAGDTYCYDEQGALDKRAREERAADRLFGLLPTDQAAEFRALWEEFEAEESADARFATALDRLMPLFHNYLSNGQTWRENQIAKAQVQKRCAPIRYGSETLWQVANTIIDDAVRRGHLRAGV